MRPKLFWIFLCFIFLILYGITNGEKIDSDEDSKEGRGLVNGALKLGRRVLGIKEPPYKLIDYAEMALKAYGLYQTVSDLRSTKSSENNNVNTKKVQRDTKKEF